MRARRGQRLAAMRNHLPSHIFAFAAMRNHLPTLLFFSYALPLCGTTSPLKKAGHLCITIQMLFQLVCRPSGFTQSAMRYPPRGPDITINTQAKTCEPVVGNALPLCGTTSPYFNRILPLNSNYLFFFLLRTAPQVQDRGGPLSASRLCV